MMLRALWLLYAAVNGFTFALYGADKRRAMRRAWRIPERVLLLWTWLMGGVGAWLGMKLFHHKTLHARFRIGVPIAAELSLALMALATLRLLGVL